MTFWQEHHVEDKVVGILEDVPEAAGDHHHATGSRARDSEQTGERRVAGCWTSYSMVEIVGGV
jgi:hypothetical protein